MDRAKCPKIFLANKNLCRARIDTILVCCQQQWHGGGSSHSKPSARNRGSFQPCGFLFFRDQSHQFLSRIFLWRTLRVAKKEEQKSQFWQLMQCGSALITCFDMQNCKVLKGRKKKNQSIPFLKKNFKKNRQKSGVCILVWLQPN